MYEKVNLILLLNATCIVTTIGLFFLPCLFKRSVSMQWMVGFWSSSSIPKKKKYVFGLSDEFSHIMCYNTYCNLIFNIHIYIVSIYFTLLLALHWYTVCRREIPSNTRAVVITLYASKCNGTEIVKENITLNQTKWRLSAQLMLIAIGQSTHCTPQTHTHGTNK